MRKQQQKTINVAYMQSIEGVGIHLLTLLVYPTAISLKQNKLFTSDTNYNKCDRWVFLFFILFFVFISNLLSSSLIVTFVVFKFLIENQLKNVKKKRKNQSFS